MTGAPELLDELELLEELELELLLEELELLLDELELDELELLEELEDEDDDDESPLPGLLPPQPPNIKAHMTGTTAKRGTPISQNLFTRTPKVKLLF